MERAETGGAGSSETAAWDLQLALTPEAQDRLLAAALPPVTLAFGCLLLLRGAEHVATAAAGFPRSGAAAGVPSLRCYWMGLLCSREDGRGSLGPCCPGRDRAHSFS